MKFFSTLLSLLLSLICLIFGHNFSPATCEEPIICDRCNVTSGEALGHNYVDGICSVCESVDLISKEKEITEENERHTNAINEITESRDWLVNINQDRIDNIKSEYGFTYVYDELTCVQKISALNSELSDVNYQIFRIEPYKNETEYIAKYRNLQAQKIELEQEILKYEKMRDINDYLYAIESAEDDYNHKIQAENQLHQENLNSIEEKYSSK